MEALILRCLPAGLRRHATEERLLVLRQFLRFAAVGFIGFTVDTACVYALRDALGLYLAGVIAWAVAVSGNWVINRLWTFRGRGAGPAHRQWFAYAMVNVIGFVFNRGAYALMVTFVAAAAAEPILATMAGAVCGMFFNFFLSRAFVFR
jgi:putative flippase GtrA